MTFQPNDPVQLTRRTEKRLNNLERRANPNWRIFSLENRGLENKIINGDFRINQRAYVSAAALLPGSYGFDRWRASGYTNKAPNPTAGTASTPWVATTGVASRLTGLTIPGLSGVTTAVRNTISSAATGGLYYPGDASATTAGLRIPVIPGRLYRVSVWLRASVAKTIQPQVQLTNAAFGVVASITSSSTVALVANTWTRVSWTFTADLAAGVVAQAGPYWYSTTAWAIGNTLDAAGLLFAETSEDPDYFDGSFAGASWAGTAHASASYSVAVVPTLTYTTAPQGQFLTLNTGSQINQVVDRTNVPAGTYVVSHEGTAEVRVYNKGSTAPVYAASPVVVVLDGLTDVIVEFQATGGTATVGRVSMYSGAIAFPFEPRLQQQELALCLRYYWRYDNASASVNIMVGTGSFYAASNVHVPLQFPVPMRVAPQFTPSSGGVLRCQYQGVASSSSLISYAAASTTHIRLALTIGGTSTAGYSCFVELLPVSYLELNAEYM